VLVQATVVRGREHEPLSLRRALLAAAAGFGSTAGAHLVFVWLTAPADLPHWIGSVYLGIFSGQGVTGDKLSALSRYADGAQPLWYYPALLYAAHSVVLPLTLFGLAALLRRGRAHALSVLSMAFGAALGLIPLSVPAFKEPLYVLALAPPLYALAATCLSELEGDAYTHAPANRAMIAVATGVAALSALTFVLSALAGAASFDDAALHVLGMGGCAVLAHALYRRRSALGPLAVLSIAGVAAAFARDHQLYLR
jgi:4-amino-4-deoxy-L-arabinose transferase-like glycosyltransferase